MFQLNSTPRSTYVIDAPVWYVIKHLYLSGVLFQLTIVPL